MTHLRPFLLLLTGLLLGCQIHSQAPDFTGKDPNTTEGTFKLQFSKTSGYCIDDVFTAHFTGEVQDGWHLYSARKDGEIMYNPTELVIFEDESAGIALVGKMTENKTPREYEDTLMGGTIRDFKEHKVKFSQKMKFTERNVNVVGELAAQICTDAGICKFLRLPFEWKLTVEACPTNGGTDTNNGGNGSNTAKNGGNNGNTDSNGSNGSNGENVVDGNPDGVQPIDTVDSATAAVSGDTASGTAAEGSDPKRTEFVIAPPDDDCGFGGLWGKFFLAFAIGLGAILTPCVYPMIPLTVSFFSKDSMGKEEKTIADRAKAIKNGLLYGGSIVFIYTATGAIVTAATGDPTALYNLSSHPILNTFFFIIFFVFALSFLGMFELTLPSSWSTKINAKASKGGGLGVFFMALTLVLVSFSCTGPFLGTVLVGSAQGDACIWSPIMSMAGFGMAFAIPFGLFAVFPSWLNRLPQAGGWMNTVKVVFGFLELALCMKFLSNVDLALHWHILDRHVFLGWWIVIFVLLGIYFIGWITMPHDDKIERTPVPRLILAIMSFSFAMYLVPGLWGGSLSMVEGLVPPMTKNVGVKLLPHQVVDAHAPAAPDGADGDSTYVILNDAICDEDRKYAFLFEDREAHGFCMFYDLGQALEFAKKVNKPLFVDFTGHTCANCRKMENDVWVDDKVREKLRNDFVMVSLYADEPHKLEKTITKPDGTKLRRIKDWVQDYQRTNYYTIAQPYYVLMDHDESALALPRGYTPDIQAFDEYLKSGISEFNIRHKVSAKGGQ